MKALAVRLLAEVAARATPLTIADAEILVDLGEALAAALFHKGVVCEKHGHDGYHEGRRVCMPGRWRDEDRRRHAAECGNCPVFRKAFSKWRKS